MTAAQQQYEMTRFQDDMVWSLGGLRYHDDEHTLERRDTEIVQVGERAELERFSAMCVYTSVEGQDASGDRNIKVVEVKWRRTRKGTQEAPEDRCRLVAQEPGCGERLDELLQEPGGDAPGGDGIHGHGCEVRLPLWEGAPQGPARAAGSGHADQRGRRKMGHLAKDLHGTCNAPHICPEEVLHEMKCPGYQASVSHPSVYFNHVG